MNFELILLQRLVAHTVHDANQLGTEPNQQTSKHHPCLIQPTASGVIMDSLAVDVIKTIPNRFQHDSSLWVVVIVLIAQFSRKLAILRWLECRHSQLCLLTDLWLSLSLSLSIAVSSMATLLSFFQASHPAAVTLKTAIISSINTITIHIITVVIIIFGEMLHNPS